VFAWYPALRWHERYLGLLKEQKNLKRNAKGKRAKTCIGKPEIPMFFSGADEVVVVMIASETGQERRTSHEEFLFV
jgi:hypothetical protein